MTLKMTDKTMAQLEGVLEDVLIKMGNFFFPMDFVVMGMEKDTQVLLLLRRPFLATRAALISVMKGEPTLRVGDDSCHSRCSEINKIYILNFSYCRSKAFAV